MWQRFDWQARRVVSSAQQEAARSDNIVTAEHLLMVLLRENGTMAARILDQLGVSRAALQAEVGRQLGPPDLRGGCLSGAAQVFLAGCKEGH